MWKIKDPKLKQWVNRFFSDEKIDKACRAQLEDGPAYTIRAKLRYRIDRSGGELRLWYELQQLQRVFAKAMEAHVQKLEELLSGELPIYSGR